MFISWKVREIFINSAPWYQLNVNEFMFVRHPEMDITIKKIIIKFLF